MEKLIQVFANAIEITTSEVNENSVLNSFPTWDSLGMITFIAMINQEYGKQIKAEDLRQAMTIKDLNNLLD